jgi:hypothetical protein
MTDEQALSADERDDFVTRLAAVVGLHSPALSDNPVYVFPLIGRPTYPGAALFDVEVHLRQRPLTFRVADCAGELIVLGSVEGVEELNRRVGLRLQSADEVVEYVRFWFWAAQRGGQLLVETEADPNWLEATETDAEMGALRDRAAHLVRPVMVGHPAHDAYPAEATVLDQRTLELRHLRVHVDGHVDETIREPLMDNVPVPYVMS